MFEKAREKYKDGEYKILIAKIIDKYNFSKTKNKITYVFYGVKNQADRNSLIFYPEKISKEMVEKNYTKIFEVIRIILPNNIKYEHREFLSGIMKLGIKREKFGDILVTEYGADIIVFSEISKILLEDLKTLTRFKKSDISIVNIGELMQKEIEFEELEIIVSSIRLDNFVSELAKCSRAQASELIKTGRVFLNYINEFKDSKRINQKDIITIRGKGKFIFEDIEKETKSGRLLIKIKKYK